MERTPVSTKEAKQDKLFYVVANLIIVDPVKSKCLILKRSEHEKVHPGKWAFPGGKLEHSDVVRLLEESGNSPLEGVDNILGKLAMREAEEESGLTVDENSTRVIKNKVFVRPDGVPVFMTTLAADYQGGAVILEQQSFSDSAWVSISELADYDTIEGITEEAPLALSR